MRELNHQEWDFVAGSGMFGDIHSLFSNGLTEPEQTLMVVALGSGILLGGALSYEHIVLAPIVSFALLGGWYFYTCSHSDMPTETA